jgi:hypothetical protein
MYDIQMSGRFSWKCDVPETEYQFDMNTNLNLEGVWRVFLGGILSSGM